MTKISIVINADTRAGFKNSESIATQMFEGCRSLDFLTEGVINKIKFFEGFDKEVILFIDEHESVPESAITKIKELVDVLVIRKHTTEHLFNDFNYLRALQLASGDIIAHFDQDCAAFKPSHLVIDFLISVLNDYSFVSYPSSFYPRPVNDPSFDYDWVSTRFFMCKRETLDFKEIDLCLRNYDYLYEKYPASRRCHWMEHILGLHAKYNGKGVCYPKIAPDLYSIFCWNKYVTGTMWKMNHMNYEEVKNYIERASGIQYPNDLTALPL